MRQKLSAIAILLFVVADVWSQSLFEGANAAAKSTTAKPVEQLYPLSRDNGPVMVSVASFMGDDGQKFANELVSELRNKHKLEAYTYRFQAELPQVGPTKQWQQEYKEMHQGNPNLKLRTTKFRTEPPINWVVLAGNFSSFDDRVAKRTLEKIREIQPKTLSQDAYKQLRLKRTNPNAPLATASLTMNPLTPNHALNDADRQKLKMLEELNANEPLSVYNLSAPLTIRVAIFQGRSSTDKEKLDQLVKGRLKSDYNLEVAAKNAIILGQALRDMGFEAYVFHGQYASLVTIGGYLDYNDPNLLRDLDKFSKTRVGELKLAPWVMPTPRRPAELLHAVDRMAEQEKAAKPAGIFGGKVNRSGN